ncbi:MAG: hypothetical protein ABI144_12530 [Gallionella sp.]
MMQLVRAGRKSIIMAFSGFVLPFLFGFILCYWGFGLAMIVFLFAAGTITATSIGIAL